MPQHMHLISFDLILRTICRGAPRPEVVRAPFDQVCGAAGTHPNYRQHRLLPGHQSQGGRREPGCRVTGIVRAVAICYRTTMIVLWPHIYN